MTDPAPPIPGKSPPSPSSISWARLAIAMGIALASDAFSFATSAWIVLEPVVLAIDLATAVLIWLALGRPVLLLAVFVAEAIPGIGVFPLWTAAVGALAVAGRIPTRVTGRSLPQSGDGAESGKPAQKP